MWPLIRHGISFDYTVILEVGLEKNEGCYTRRRTFTKGRMSMSWFGENRHEEGEEA
jgi:hypothetical protein